MDLDDARTDYLDSQTVLDASGRSARLTLDLIRAAFDAGYLAGYDHAAAISKQTISEFVEKNNA